MESLGKVVQLFADKFHGACIALMEGRNQNIYDILFEQIRTAIIENFGDEGSLGMASWHYIADAQHFGHGPKSLFRRIHSDTDNVHDQHVSSESKIEYGAGRHVCC
ncbi:MAG: hypothetical protein GY820_48635 [Gammaproteobacteria bacterium]|nr:hypothetical protein [Gammaproteobacteria bacterium]